MRLELGPSLEALKTRAIEQIDREAEETRLLFITPGSGQALEYQMTERQARAWKALRDAGETPSLEDFPFVKAEMDALEAATGEPQNPDAVVAAVIAEADLWVTVGAEIKRIRREAKMRVEAATSAPEVRAILGSLDWPRP